MYLLDTNAISEPKRARPDQGLLRWLGGQLLTDLYISAISLGELRRGVIRLGAGPRRDDLDFWLAQAIDRFNGRVLGVDLRVAERWAVLAEDHRSQGRSIDLTDELIAATALVHGLAVVTRNVRHFEHAGCKVLNPWSG